VFVHKAHYSHLTPPLNWLTITAGDESCDEDDSDDEDDDGMEWESVAVPDADKTNAMEGSFATDDVARLCVPFF
jgi:hypothetical protein